MMLESKLLKG